MSIWDILGIEPTHDISEIKNAYSEQSKLHHPEDDPEGYQALKNAYKIAVSMAKRKAAASVTYRAEPEHEATAQDMPEQDKPEDNAYSIQENEEIIDFRELLKDEDRANQNLEKRCQYVFSQMRNVYNTEKYKKDDWDKIFNSPEFISLKYEPTFIMGFMLFMKNHCEFKTDFWKTYMLPFITSWQNSCYGTDNFSKFKEIHIKHDLHANAAKKEKLKTAMPKKAPKVVKILGMFLLIYIINLAIIFIVMFAIVILEKSSPSFESSIVYKYYMWVDRLIAPFSGFISSLNLSAALDEISAWAFGLPFILAPLLCMPVYLLIAGIGALIKLMKNKKRENKLSPFSFKKHWKVFLAVNTGLYLLNILLYFIFQ